MLYKSLIIVVIACFSNFALASADGMSPNESAYLNSRLATVRVAVDHAPFYAAPKPNANRVSSLAWVNSLLVDASRMQHAPAGWIPIKLLYKNATKGWVRRSDVVLPVDYKKVTGCWPIKSVTFVAGDYAAEVTFQLDGSALIKEWGDEESINKAPPHKAHVYMARNIVSIDDIKGKAGFFTSGYRPDQRQLYPEGAPADKQEQFPESMLTNCPSIPVLKQK